MKNTKLKKIILELLKFIILKKAGLNKCKMFIVGSAPNKHRTINFA